MCADSSRRHPTSRTAALCLAAVFTLLRLGRAAAADETTTLDCGVNALYVLLCLEGRPVTLDRLLSALPARHPSGYSMGELATAARTLGLKVEGV